MAFWIGTLTLLAVTTEHRIRLEVVGDTCALQTALDVALAQKGVSRAESSDTRLRVVALGDEISVQLSTGGAARGGRRIPITSGDCPALPKAIAMLVRSWLDLPWSPPAVQKPLRTRPIAPAPLKAPTPGDEQPSPPTDASLELRPVEQLDDPDLPVDPGPAKGERSVLSGVVLLGAAASPGDWGTVNVALALEVAFLRRWSGALEGGVDTPRLSSSVHTALRVDVSWLGLGVRRTVWAPGNELLQLGLAARLIHFHASIEEVGGVDAADILTGALVGDAEWRHTFSHGVFVLLRAAIQARFRPQHFGVAGDTPSVVVPPWSAALQGGLGWTAP